MVVLGQPKHKTIDLRVNSQANIYKNVRSFDLSRCSKWCSNMHKSRMHNKRKSARKTTVPIAAQLQEPQGPSVRALVDVLYKNHRPNGYSVDQMKSMLVAEGELPNCIPRQAIRTTLNEAIMQRRVKKIHRNQCTNIKLYRPKKVACREKKRTQSKYGSRKHRRPSIRRLASSERRSRSRCRYYSREHSRPYASKYKPVENRMSYYPSMVVRRRRSRVRFHKGHSVNRRQDRSKTPSERSSHRRYIRGDSRRQRKRSSRYPSY